MLTPMKPMTPEDLQKNILATYFTLRSGLIALSAALPLVLYFCNVHQYGYLHEHSISAFYGADDGRLRNYFVATLCIVGALLIMYKGFSVFENWLLKIAGTCAVLVALTPCDCWRQADGGPDGHNVWHTTFAVTFFACMVLICELCARDTITLLPTQALRDNFARAYHAIALLLFLAPVAAIGAAYVARVPKSSVFFIEWFAVYLFMFYWAVKSAEFHITSAEKRAVRGELKKVKDYGLTPVSPSGHL